MIEPIVPDWPAPERVRAFTTTRAGGVSTGPFSSLNLGRQSGDDPAAVAVNHERLAALLPVAPLWPRQVHGTAVAIHHGDRLEPAIADAVVAFAPGQVCAVLTADCLPVVFTDDDGSRVAVAHAGWRGLAAGVLEATVAALDIAPDALLAWLGPAIGPAVYEVGPEVREAFVGGDAGAGNAFTPSARTDHYCADLYALARRRLATLGIARTSGGGHCTATERDRFFSHRRDGVSGRMATCAWLGTGDGDPV